MEGTFAVTLALMLSFVAFPAAGQDPSKPRVAPPVTLDQSPRHQEWVAVKHGDRIVHSFLVFPEVKEKAPVVVVIHENRGLTDWVRGVADQLAEAGVIAIAPDLLSGAGPGGGKTSDFPSSDAASQAIYKLPPEQVTADLKAVADHAAKLPASNGKVAVAGFCWGGGQAFRFATDRPDLAAACVFYGTGPDALPAVSRIKCPVYGFYGEKDARVDATIEKTRELMKEAGKVFEPVTYEGAGHGFMRAGEEPDADPAAKKARQDAWSRWKGLLKKL
jgi:carboxymethylenebutenolidase